MAQLRSGELWQLVLDLVHLLLFCFLALAPWRLMQYMYFAGQPSEASRGVGAARGDATRCCRWEIFLDPWKALLA